MNRTNLMQQAAVADGYLGVWNRIPTFDELVAGHEEPRVHGNGFLQLNLNAEGTRRLHIWDCSLPRQVVATPIHDHVFAMRSTVILGMLEHTELEAVSAFRGGMRPATHRVYRAKQIEGTQNTELVPDDGLVRLETVQRLILHAGSIYTFPAGALHTSYNGLDLHGFSGTAPLPRDQTTATIMEKIEAPPTYGRPRVLCEIGQEPDNDFNRDGHDPAMLWGLIEKTLWRVWEGWGIQ